eukprot:NODE_3262_length_577_cov_1087.579545_g2747_i0.p1 GENE.NODE_3262_length_577_cov_1087.579545_g2747_i0~~NODE_3262_length_577_cov_1087.579545_g2747_i0.p1  ORF type:complete len:129 (-),score=39.68 NODE_3262_length_577_cov_1087.579545_g2747_i0:189-524(-)
MSALFGSSFCHCGGLLRDKKDQKAFCPVRCGLNDGKWTGRVGRWAKDSEGNDKCYCKHNETITDDRVNITKANKRSVCTKRCKAAGLKWTGGVVQDTKEGDGCQCRKNWQC